MLKKTLFTTLISLTLATLPLANAKTPSTPVMQAILSPEDSRFQQEVNNNLAQAVTAFQQHQYGETMRFTDKIIQRYQQYETANNVKLFSVRNSQEAKIIQDRLSSVVKKPIKIVPDNLQSAFYLQAFIYNELGRYAQASMVLDTALTYAPTNARLYNERALAYQGLKDWKNADRYFEMAEKNSQFSGNTQLQDKTRSWRGRGFVATEEHRFDDAVAWYQKCLAIDPNDAQAKGELQYITKIRGNPPKKNTLPFGLIKK